MKAKHSLIVFAAAVVGVVGPTWVRSGGLGIKDTVVEHVFKYEGRRMAVMREDFVGWGHNRYVQGIKDESFQPRDGEEFLYINPQVLNPVKAYNFSGQTDDGEAISVTQDGFQIAFKKQ
jgi:hypothetical protein